MKKGNLDDALRILGFNINANGNYVYANSKDSEEKPIEDNFEEDDEEPEADGYEYEADEEISDINEEDLSDEEETITEIPVEHSLIQESVQEDIPIKMPGDKELTIEEATDFIKEMLTGDSKGIMDVNNNAKLTACLVMVADKVNDLMYKSNSDYIGKTKALEQKIENYKKEFDRAKDLERKLYLIASAEERFCKHISDFGYEEIVLRDMSKATASWQEYIEKKTGIVLSETRDIGEILLALKENAINNKK